MKQQNVQEVTATDKIVMIRTTHQTAEGQPLCFGFSSRQVVEVRMEVKKRPIPFADSSILGISPWNNMILPVIDLAMLFGAAAESGTADVRYLILRTGTPQNRGQAELYHAVVKVPARLNIIAAEDVEPSSVPEGVDPQLIRGAYHIQDKVLVVPDLLQILHVEHGHS